MANLDQKYEALFTPWKIGNVEIKNRIVMCPMGGTSLFGWFELGGCHFDKEAAALFLERAKNNVGLIIPGIAPLRDTFWGKWLWQNPKMFEEFPDFQVRLIYFQAVSVGQFRKRCMRFRLIPVSNTCYIILPFKQPLVADTNLLNGYTDIFIK